MHMHRMTDITILTILILASLMPAAASTWLAMQLPQMETEVAHDPSQEEELRYAMLWVA